MISPEAVQRLNDEIITLRANMDAITSRALSKIREARLKALEEAAQQCEAQRVYSDALNPFDIAHNHMCRAFALAIRALKHRDVTTLERLDVEPARQGRPGMAQRPGNGGQTTPHAASPTGNSNHQARPSMIC